MVIVNDPPDLLENVRGCRLHRKGLASYARSWQIEIRCHPSRSASDGGWWWISSTKMLQETGNLWRSNMLSRFGGDHWWYQVWKKKISWLVKLEIDRFQHLRHKFGGEMTPLGTSNWEMASTLACPSWTNVLQQKAPCAYETSWTIKHQNLKKKHALNLSTIKDAFSEKSWEIHKRLAPKRASSALVAHPRHEAARCPRPRSKCGCGGGTLMGQP